MIRVIFTCDCCGEESPNPEGFGDITTTFHTGNHLTCAGPETFRLCRPCAEHLNKQMQNFVAIKAKKNPTIQPGPVSKRRSNAKREGQK